MNSIIIAWQNIPYFKGDEDLAIARHNLVQNILDAATNKARKLALFAASIVVAEGGEPGLSRVSKFQSRSRHMPLRGLLREQSKAYKRASHFYHRLKKAVLPQQQAYLKAKQNEQLAIHDAMVNEIARRVSAAVRKEAAK